MIPFNYQGHLLVSMPHIEDALFSEAVILIIEHTAELVMGAILNKVDDLPVSLLKKDYKLDFEEAALLSLPILHGGPVYLKALFTLHQQTPEWPDSQKIANDIAITDSPELLNKILHSEFNAPYRVIRGFSLWKPDQLSDEIKNNTWMLFPLEKDIVFDPNPATMWANLFARHGINLINVTSEIGTS